jgi:excisionase family DNA binding protein
MRLLTAGQAARLRGVSVDTVRRWEKTGRLRPVMRIGRGLRIYNEVDVINA